MTTPQTPQTAAGRLPDHLRALLEQAVAVARRGPTANVNRLDREIVENAIRRGERRKP